jgi:porphobilinogen synthase
MNLPIRPRRNRRNPSIRSLVRETVVTPGDLIQPLFVHAGSDDQPIASMPGCTRWSLDGLVREAGETHELGVPAVVIFPAIEESLKTPGAEEAWNPQGLVPQAIRALKRVEKKAAKLGLEPLHKAGELDRLDLELRARLEFLHANRDRKEK